VQRGDCDLSHLPARLIEEKIVQHYARLCISADFADELTETLDAAITDLQATELELAQNLSVELKKLTEQEERLLDAIQDDLLPRERIVERLAGLRTKRSSLTERLGNTTAELETGATLLRQSIALAQDPYALYSKATDDARAHINQAFFVALWINEHGSVEDSTLAEPFETIEAVHRMWLQLGNDGATGNEAGPANAKERSRLTEALLAQNQPLSPNPTGHPVLGLNSAVMVGLTGFEPATP
jgi:hypothetical protein